MKTHEELLEKYKRRDLMEELGYSACYTRRGYMNDENADYYSWLALAAYRRIKELEAERDAANEAMVAMYGAIPKWLDVRDQLPEDNERVLVIDEGRINIGFCERYKGEECTYTEWHDTLYYPIDPPCWMPLPEIPSEVCE